MEEVTSTTVHQFGQGLLVEIVGLDENGNIATETIEFDLLNSSQGVVKPRGDVSTEHEECVRDLLSENGYSISNK